MVGQARRHQGYTGRLVMPGARLPRLARQQGRKAVQTQGFESLATLRKKRAIAMDGSLTNSLMRPCH
eukprot:8147287-Karenia_brevis.AAC.1